MPNNRSEFPVWTASRRWVHGVAVLAAAVCWPLLISGGQVTSFGVGMAVPDWPTTFGINMFLYRFWEASWGVFIEHRHRLFGTALGMAAIVLAAWFLVAERRTWMKVLGVGALLAVIGQGLLGRNRILLDSTLWAAIHGVTGQAVFALLVILTVLTGRDWLETQQRQPDPVRLRRRAGVMLALVAAQLVLGARLRHFGLGLWLHLVVGLGVWGHAAALAWRVERQRQAVPALLPSARALGLLASLQVVLGLSAWWLHGPYGGLPHPPGTVEALVRTAHQSNGALVLAATVVLALRAFRHLAAPAHPSYSRQPEVQAPLDLETVA